MEVERARLQLRVNKELIRSLAIRGKFNCSLAGIVGINKTNEREV